jgi:hypothetical protein
MTSKHVCRVCGLPVRLWHYGWKHSGGGNSKKACCQPVPMERAETNDAPTDEAIRENVQ